ncbi:MAG: hypothetical protein E7362_03725 [Clostridiales bacterium]|nr:hypothetical protein [Clostridiales bacterium]
MFNFTKKKTLIGLIGFALSVGLAVLLIQFSKTGSITELDAAGIAMRIGSVLLLSLALGCLFYVFFDLKMCIITFSAFSVIFLFRVLIEFTSESSPSLTLFLISLVVIVGLFFMSYRQYKNNNFNINGKNALSKKEQKKLENYETEISAIQKEDEEFRNSISYGSQSIILGTQGMGTLFQVIKTTSGLLFHHVGSILKGVDQTKLIDDFSNIETINLGEKDYVIKFEEIDKITAKIRDHMQMMDYGNIKFTLKNSKNKRYGFINKFTENELNAFFDNKVDIANKTKNDDESSINDQEKSKLSKLNVAFFVHSIVSAVAFGVYFMSFNNIVSAIFATLCIILCLLPFALYIAFPKYISIKDHSRYASTVQNGKLNILLNVLMFPILFALISLLKGTVFTHYNTIKLLIYSVVLFLVLIASLFIFTKEYKKEKSVIFVAIMVFLALSPSIVHNVNVAYDFSKPEQIHCQIVDNSTWVDKKNNITYYLTFKYGEQEIKTEVSKETYEKYNVGEEISVIKKQGALGIDGLILIE